MYLFCLFKVLITELSKQLVILEGKNSIKEIPDYIYFVLFIFDLSLLKCHSVPNSSCRTCTNKQLSVFSCVLASESSQFNSMSLHK